MLGKVNTLFTRSKLAAKRISSLILAVFVLQVTAAGFCAPLAQASPVEELSAMEHCLSSSMKLTDTSMANTASELHACTHCDLPDVNMVADKQATSAVDLPVNLLVLAIVPTTLDIEVVPFFGSPPGLLTLKTSLNIFNLNLRIRV